MTRPEEYENLIKTGHFKDHDGKLTNIIQYLEVATQLSQDAKNLSFATSKYTLAYDGFFQIVQAVLEFYNVRSTDKQGHRIIAIQRICADLGIRPGGFKLISIAHDRRNQVTYGDPFPPISQEEASAMLHILDETIPKVKALLKIP